jgi:hypothetical protein
VLAINQQCPGDAQRHLGDPTNCSMLPAAVAGSKQYALNLTTERLRLER